MHTASLELSRKLYELSGWKGSKAGNRWFLQANQPHLAEQPETFFKPVADTESAMYNDYPYFEEEVCPAYDLGYVLRKLPPNIEVRNHFLWDIKGGRITPGGWANDMMRRVPAQTANTPEDAAVQLAIALFEQGILK